MDEYFIDKHWYQEICVIACLFITDIELLGKSIDKFILQE